MNLFQTAGAPPVEDGSKVVSRCCNSPRCGVSSCEKDRESAALGDAPTLDVVFEADDGEKALELLLAGETRQPTVILLDLRLPVMSGPDLLNVLKCCHRGRSWAVRDGVLLDGLRHGDNELIGGERLSNP